MISVFQVEICMELKEPIDEFGVENMVNASDELNSRAANDEELSESLAMTVSDVWEMRHQLRDLRWREEAKGEVMEHEDEICELEQALQGCPAVIKLQMHWVKDKNSVYNGCFLWLNRLFLYFL